MCRGDRVRFEPVPRSPIDTLPLAFGAACRVPSAPSDPIGTPAACTNTKKSSVPHSLCPTSTPPYEKDAIIACFPFLITKKPLAQLKDVYYFPEYFPWLMQN